MKLKSIISLSILALITLATPALQAGEFLTVSGDKVPGQYIVVFQDEVPAAGPGLAIAEAHGGRVERTWDAALNGAVVSGMSEEAARALARKPQVLWVEEDGIVTIDATQSSAPWGLDRIDQRSVSRDGDYEYLYNGSGIHVYILDTGIRDTHDEFEDSFGNSRASRDYDNVGGGWNGGDCHGHGTHVAGTIGGNTYGVAKRVNLHGVRVLGCDGTGPTSDVIDGVNWVRNNATQPAVANMSLGGSTNSSLDTAVNNAVNSGIFFAVAAGNSNTNACNSSPARATEAYTVAATDSSDRRASFSNYGGCVNIFAPGVSITSAWNSSDTATSILSGTSMATPHVAGVAALVLDQFPSFTPAQVEAQIEGRLTHGGISNRGSGSPNEMLYSLPSLLRPTSVSVFNERCFGLNEVSWASVSGATYYQLYRSSSSSFTSQTLVYSGSDLSRPLSVTSTTYVRVRACNSSGCSSYRPGNRSAIYYNGCL